MQTNENDDASKGISIEQTANSSKKATAHQTSKKYRWKTGDCLATYGISANKWREFTSTDEFAVAFMAIVEDDKVSNDVRADRVEQFLLEQATKAEVVDVSSTHREFTNPNKWDKHMAPWFSSTC
jgi:hypothetical protein